MNQSKNLIRTVCLIYLFMIYRGDTVRANSSQKCFKTLFQFGASLFDTGNAVIAFPQQAFQPARPPYGSTFPGHPDSRYCDGKLIVDHLADAFKVPLLNPFLGGFGQLVKKGSGLAVERRDYRNGVCFSVALATALSVPELLLAAVKILNVSINPLTSDVQYQWFQAFKRASSVSAEFAGKLGQEFPSPEAFESALYLPGEFGGNDYRAALLSGLSFEKVKGMVPSVVEKIVQLTQNLYKVGARNFLVMGVPPQGCTPFYLTTLNGSRDEFNCHLQVNEIYRLHDSFLKIAIKGLREKLQDTNIMFADYCEAFMSVMRHPLKYGIKVRNAACCGGGGPYNYNPEAVCGTDSCKRCSNPESHIFWDDFHTTDAFNHIIANKFLSGEFVDPPAINLGCSS